MKKNDFYDFPASEAKRFDAATMTGCTAEDCEELRDAWLGGPLYYSNYGSLGSKKNMMYVDKSGHVFIADENDGEISGEYIADAIPGVLDVTPYTIEVIFEAELHKDLDSHELRLGAIISTHRRLYESGTIRNEASCLLCCDEYVSLMSDDEAKKWKFIDAPASEYMIAADCDGAPAAVFWIGEIPLSDWRNL